VIVASEDALFFFVLVIFCRVSGLLWLCSKVGLPGNFDMQFAQPEYRQGNGCRVSGLALAENHRPPILVDLPGTSHWVIFHAPNGCREKLGNGVPGAQGPERMPQRSGGLRGGGFKLGRLTRQRLSTYPASRTW